MNNSIIANAGKDIITNKQLIGLDAQIPVVGRGKWSSAEPGIQFDDPENPKTLVSGLTNGLNLLIWTVRNNNYEASDELLILYKK